MTDLLELAARVEGLTVPDREVDALIWCALHGVRYKGHNQAYGEEVTQVEFTRPPKRTREASGRYMPHALLYTASVDHAMSLVPEGWGYGLDYAPSGSGLRFTLGSPDLEPVFVHGEAMTLPRAITAAALRARAHGGGEG